MKKIFLSLLRKYSETEKGRLEILKVVNDKMEEEYNEQTPAGNVYNFFIEFVMANKTILRHIEYKNNSSLERIKRGISDSYDIAIGYVDNEQFKLKKKQTF